MQGMKRTRRAAHSDVIGKSPGVGVPINLKIVWQLTFLSFGRAFL